jgi:hypothetical protein
MYARRETEYANEYAWGRDLKRLNAADAGGLRNVSSASEARSSRALGITSARRSRSSRGDHNAAVRYAALTPSRPSSHRTTRAGT